MKILMVSEFFPDTKTLTFSGGVEAREYFVAKYLSKRHQVTVLTSYLGAPKVEKFGRLTILKVGQKRSYRAVTGNVGERLRFVREAIKEGSKVEADLVDGCNFIAHFVAAQIAWKKKIPAVAWYPEVWKGSWIKNAGMVGLTGEILERVNLKRDFAGYIAISEETAKKLRKFTKKRIQTIYCGVDEKEFRGKAKKFKQLTVITIGRLSVNKNQRVIVEALNYLNDIMCNLIIVGSGPRERFLRKQVRDLGLSQRVKFYEKVSRKKLVSLIKSSHILATASKLEGFGISIIEGAVAGLPFVISNIPVHKEVTRNGEGGFLVEPDNPKKFAEKIRILLENREIYGKKSKSAQNLARRYDWERIAKETEEMFKSLT